MKRLSSLFLLFGLFVFTILNSQTTEYVWTGQIGGNGDEDYGDFTADAEGNLYVAGRFDDFTDLNPFSGTSNYNEIGVRDGFLTKITPDSAFVWSVRMGGASAQVYIYDIYIASDSSIYLGGSFNNTVDFDPGVGTFELTSLGSYDAFLLHLDSDGSFISAFSFGDSGLDLIRCIKQNSLSDFLILGEFDGTVDFDPGAGIEELTAPDGSTFLLKNDSSGNFQWVKQIEGSSGNSPSSDGLAISDSDGIFILAQYSGTVDLDPGVGTFNLTSVNNYDVVFCKWDANGNFLWGGDFKGTGQAFSKDIEVDDSGNVYISGDFNNTIDFDPSIDELALEAVDYSGFNTYNAFLVKLNPDGSLNWAKKIGDQGYIILRDMYLHNNTDLYLCGTYKGDPDMDPDAGEFFADTTGVNNGFYGRYNLDGEFDFVETIVGIGWIETYRVLINEDGNLYHSGDFNQYSDFDPGVDTIQFQATGFWDEDIYISRHNLTANPGCVGDANLDNLINILDLVAVSSNFGCSSGCTGNGDANFDGVVNILDFIAVSSNFGTNCN